MSEIDPLVLEVIADLRKFKQEMAGARRLTDINMDGMERRSLAMAKSLDSSFSLASKAALRYATGLTAGFATFQGAKMLLDVADEAKTLDAQLRLASAGFGSFAQAQQDVRRIAEETRSGLSETAALYGNFSRGAKELGATQAEAARATETFSKTLTISGADANQAASATLQFGQALAAGALRGDELNSILEASPRLARLLAESMGQPIGQIKAMGEAGELTSAKLLRALTDQKFTDGIDAEFRQLPVTFSQAMTQVENAALVTFGAFDRGGQFSSMLANFVLDGSAGFGDLEQAALDMGTAVRGQLEGLAAAFGPVIQGARDLIAAMNQVSAAGGEAQGSKEFLRGTADDLYRWSGGKGVIGRGAKRFIEADDAKRQGLQFDRKALDYEDRLKAIGLGGTVADFMRPPAASAAPRATTKATGRKAAGPSAETLANRQEAEAKRVESERLKGIRDEAATRRDSARLDDEILAAKAAMATATDSILQFQLQAIENERAQRVADLETDVRLGELGRQEADRRILINSELAQLQSDLVRRRAAEAKVALAAAAVADDANTLRSEAQLVTTRKERLAIEQRILQLQQAEERARLEAAIAAGQIADAAQARANLRRRQGADEEGLLRDHASPLAQYARGFKETSLEDRGEQLVVNEIESLRKGMTDAVTSALGIQDDFFGGLISILLDQLLFQPLAEALSKGSAGGGGGLFGGLVSGLGSILGFADGGRPPLGRVSMVGERGPELFVPDSAGTIIPNHLMGRSLSSPSAAQSAGPISLTVTLSEDLDARIDNRATGVAVQVVRSTAPGIIDASATETMRRANRPRL